MDYKFEDYKINIVESKNHYGKFVATIEELYNVISIVDCKIEASEKLKPLFDKEIIRLKTGQTIQNQEVGKQKLHLQQMIKLKNCDRLLTSFGQKFSEHPIPHLLFQMTVIFVIWNIILTTVNLI